MFRHVEEVWGPEVVVSVGGPRVDAGRLDLRLDPGILDGGLVQGDGAPKGLEATRNGGDHEVPDRELREGVGGVELPRARLLFLFAYLRLGCDGHAVHGQSLYVR